MAVTMRLIGLGMIVMAILFHMVGAVVEVGPHEMNERLENSDLSQSEFDRMIAEENLFAGHLMAFAQVLLLAGIGFILYDVAKGVRRRPFDRKLL